MQVIRIAAKAASVMAFQGFNVCLPLVLGFVIKLTSILPLW